MKCANRMLAIAVSIILACPQIFARESSPIKRPFSQEEVDVRLSEYFFRKSYGNVLVPIKLLGEVVHPGLYHVPHSTSLTTLLSISGGPKTNADSDSIIVSRPGKSESDDVDLEDLVKGKRVYKLGGGETIYVPKKEGWFDHTTFTTVATISGIFGIILTAVIVSDRQNNN